MSGMVSYYQGAERHANLRALEAQLKRAIEEAQLNAQQLGTLSVTVHAIAEGMQPTVALTQDENGIHLDLGIPEGKSGQPGKKGDAFTYDDFTPEQLESLRGQEGFSPVVELTETEDGVTVTVKNKNGTESVQIPAAKFETDKTLTLENGVLSVNTAKQVEEDNTLPVTSAAVYAEVGNINALLATI